MRATPGRLVQLATPVHRPGRGQGRQVRNVPRPPAAARPGSSRSRNSAKAATPAPPPARSAAPADDVAQERGPGQPTAAPAAGAAAAPASPKSDVAATKATTKKALLTGLRNGNLEKAVEKMEADEAAAEDGAVAAGTAPEPEAVEAVSRPRQEGNDYDDDAPRQGHGQHPLAGR